jgi:hypothetical protein
MRSQVSVSKTLMGPKRRSCVVWAFFVAFPALVIFTFPSLLVFIVLVAIVAVVGAMEWYGVRISTR